MSAPSSARCCSEFDPSPWDEKELVWKNRRFVKDRVRSFLHVPLNFGAVMKRNVAAMEAAGAMPETMVVLSHECSPWSADVFIEASKDVAGAEMAALSGTFLAKVFEGPYRNMRRWIGEMRTFVGAKGKTVGKLYFYYTTCPRCAKAYGKNYVVILAQVD